MCFFKPPKFNAPGAPTPEDATAAGYRDAAKRANAKGFASTISAGSLLGAGMQTPNPTAPKSLLGG